MLQTVEATLIETIETAMGGTVKKVARHPGHWGAQTVKEMITTAPSVFVGFSAGSYLDRGQDQLQAEWHIYLVGKALNGGRSVGIYAMLDKLLPQLHGKDLGQPDALQFKTVKNLFSFADGKQGVCCFDASFTLPMHWPDLQDESSLDDWLRYHAEHYDSEDETHLMAADTVEITTT